MLKLIKLADTAGVEPTFIQLCTYRLEGAANTDSFLMLRVALFHLATDALLLNYSSVGE